MDVNLTVHIKLDDLDKIIETFGGLFNQVADIGKKEIDKHLQQEQVEEKSKKAVKKKAEELTETEIVAPVMEESRDDQFTKLKVETPKVTFDEIKAECAKLGAKGKSSQVKAKLVEYGAKCLSDIKEEKYSEFMDFLKGIE